eukprot:TRINITY_DN29296_c0_g2_i1.p1 TRINITY_DN29296_c0_g2~~TRINITY_DN29296_c0_g2_i1.p1  ORF type:complete len:776 (+),score=94.72 TRINITY_DN29296_c0_g2_i1:53-2380(+)
MQTYSRKRKQGDKFEKSIETVTQQQKQANARISSSTVVFDPQDPYFFGLDSDSEFIPVQVDKNSLLETHLPSKQAKRIDQKSPSSSPQKQYQITQQPSALEKAVSPAKEKALQKTKLFYQRPRNGENSTKKCVTTSKQKQNGKTQVTNTKKQNQSTNEQLNIQTSNKKIDEQFKSREVDRSKMQQKIIQDQDNLNKQKAVKNNKRNKKEDKQQGVGGRRSDSDGDSVDEERTVGGRYKQQQELIGLLGMLCPSGVAAIERRSYSKVTNEMEANQKGMEQQYVDDVLYSLDGLKVVGSNVKSKCNHIIGILQVVSHQRGRAIITQEQLWQQIVDTLADQLDVTKQGFHIICVGAAWLMLFLTQENIQSRLFRCSNMRKLMMGILRSASMSQSKTKEEASLVEEIVNSLQLSGVRTTVPQDLLKDGLAIMNCVLAEISHPSQPPAIQRQVQLVLGQAKLLEILAVDMCRWMGKFEKAFEITKNPPSSIKLTASQQREKMQHIQNVMFMLNKYGYLLSQLSSTNESNLRSLCAYRVTSTSNFPQLLVRCFGGVINGTDLQGCEKWKELLLSQMGLLMNITQDEDVATQKDLMDSRIVEYCFDLLGYLCGCEQEKDVYEMDIVNWNKIIEVKDLLICLLGLLINLVDTKVQNRQVLLKEKRKGMLIKILCELVQEGESSKYRRSAVSSDLDSTEVTFEQLDRSQRKQHKKTFARYASVLIGFLLLDEGEVQAVAKSYLQTFQQIENNIRNCQQHFARSKMQKEYLQLLLQLAQQVHDMQ